MDDRMSFDEPEKGKEMIGPEEFFEEIAEYLDEIVQGDLLTAEKEEFGTIQMILPEDGDLDEHQNDTQNKKSPEL